MALSSQSGGDGRDAFDALVDHASVHVGAARQCLLGITGPPGSGKSTVGRSVVDAINARHAPSDGPPAAALVPMDGFHFPSATLEARGLRRRKGSPASFDAAAFVRCLHALRQTSGPIAIPLYSRALHEPVPEALPVAPSTRVLVVEGNYLLFEETPWDAVGSLLDTVWFLDTPVDVCLARVRARHVAGGKTVEEAEERIATNDRPNAEAVRRTRGRADRLLSSAERVDGM